MDIALIGPSGAGKGTHIGNLVANFNLLHISPGDLFRENLQDLTALGIIARKYMQRGELVPDEVVDAMIEACLRKADPERGILFDGFPITIYQARFLDELLAKLGRQLDAVIYLDVSDQELERRLPGRIICRQCQTPFHQQYNPFKICPYHVCQGEYLYQREDDAPEVAGVRLKIFYRKVAPVVAHYRNLGKLTVIDGDDDLDCVQQMLIEAIKGVEQQETHSARQIETQYIQALKDLTPVHPLKQAVYPSLDIVLFGGPGSGKGTQAEQLSKHFNLPHIATGDLFRENLKRETELGKLAKTYMDRGELVPDHITEAMVRERLSQPDTAAGFILDGFPRTISQAEALTEIMTAMQRRLTGGLYIKVPDEELVKRLSGRLICRNCQTPYHREYNPPIEEGRCDICGGELYQRDDDNPATVRQRLKTFHRQTEPLFDYYQKLGLLVEIDGQGKVSEVADRAIAAVQKLSLLLPEHSSGRF